jgi:uncharacterized protein affecting Mg2+/Co2+ transport
MMEATLEDRHWKIIDGQGKVQVVDGPGVIGLFPNVKRGSVFEYTSCTTQEDTKGMMEGTFGFVNNFTGEKFRVVVGRFLLDPNKCV